MHALIRYITRKPCKKNRRKIYYSATELWRQRSPVLHFSCNNKRIIRQGRDGFVGGKKGEEKEKKSMVRGEGGEA